MDDKERLKGIRQVIECVVSRFTSLDLTVLPILDKVTLEDMRRIYTLALNFDDPFDIPTFLLQQTDDPHPFNIQFTRVCIESFRNYILAIYDGPNDSSLRINNLFDLLVDEIKNEIQRRIRATED